LKRNGTFRRHQELRCQLVVHQVLVYVQGGERNNGSVAISVGVIRPGGVRTLSVSLGAGVLFWLVQAVTTRGLAETLPEAVVRR
jgi:hypothetical protein